MDIATLEGIAVKREVEVFCWCMVVWFGGSNLWAGQTVVVVTGAAGSAEYGKKFEVWAGQWQKACEQAGVQCIQIGVATTETSDRDTLKALLADPAMREGQDALWLVLIGHGTFDGRVAKFNLRGPDVTDQDLSQWLLPVIRPLAVVNTTACSSPFLKALSAPERVVISATKSGFELNFAHFGGALAQALISRNSDLDKDGQVSLLEAFLAASDQTTTWYASQARLKTEHALIDDNADSLGTPADWFSGIRPIKKATRGASLDGYRAHQFCLLPSDAEKQFPDDLRARRNQLELAVMQLRDRKSILPEDDYYTQLEALLLQLARIYEQVGQTRSERPHSSAKGVLD
jgi:hypothetical protein